MASRPGAYPRQPLPVDAATASLLLVGHGSSDSGPASETLLGHARRLRARGAFATVAAGFLNGAPSVEEAFETLSPGLVYIVPFFVGEGYFTRIAVPRRLGLSGAETLIDDGAGCSWWLRYCAPVGTDPRLADLIHVRARRAARRNGLLPEQVVLLLIGHGNAKVPAAVSSLQQHASVLWKAGSFARVETAFIEQEPLLPNMLTMLRGKAIVVCGIFAGEGRHATDDLAAVLRAEIARRIGAGEPEPLIDLGIIGSDPLMAMLVLGRVCAFGSGG